MNENMIEKLRDYRDATRRRMEAQKRDYVNTGSEIALGKSIAYGLVFNDLQKMIAEEKAADERTLRERCRESATQPFLTIRGDKLIVRIDSGDYEVTEAAELSGVVAMASSTVDEPEVHTFNARTIALCHELRGN